MVGISALGIVPMPKKSALKTSRRELSEEVPFRFNTVGTRLMVERSTLESRLGGGGDVYRVIVYTRVSPILRGVVTGYGSRSIIAF